MIKFSQIKVPDTLVIILVLMSVAWMVTGVVPVGSFETKSVTYEFNDKSITKQVLDAESFRYRVDESGNSETNMSTLFSGEANSGFLNAVFDGITRGDRNGGAVGIIAFLLIIGGAFGVIMAPTSIHKSMLRLLVLTKGHDLLTIPILCLVFSLGGAVFGMGEEAIAFAMLLTPIMIAQGYNAIIAVLCTYVATQIGFATSWMNPFNVAVAQGLAEVPMLSGAGFRFIMWLTFTVALMIFATAYAKSIKSTSLNEKNQQLQYEKIKLESQMSLGDRLILINLFAGIAWVIWGVSMRGYYIAEIASQFFTIGLTSALITLIFKLDNLSVDNLAAAFKKGAADLVPVVLIVGFAQGILIILGGADPKQASALNTILYSTAQAIDGLPEMLSAFCMLGFQAVFNFFVTSGSGQAALTMPLLAPIADLVDVTRQTAVLTFQLGDGLTNIIVPTSAPLMGSLGVAGINWNDWAGFIWKFLLFNLFLAFAFVAMAVVIGF
ncbi:putative basic amino acid antiporter YfcC [Aliikangiella marina]|uniref:Putative basic amino acid antiporter YfcC n=1 Tax=Aliikangiella marina TaxID=1712262 RepID=A0A545TE44_9GAMM|nr:putative basic amino acid antiporter YfcC [Aliikangiella marina]TQV75489.1 putative basic amino acid antiporter YfcC [Aliikangiella marina]